MQGWPIDELQCATVERPVLEELEVEVPCSPSKIGLSPVWPVMTGKIVTCT